MEFDFDQPFLRIGRDDESDLALPHEEISHRHCYLQLIEGRLFFVDLGSRSGTYLDGRRCDHGWLGMGQVLQLGPYDLRVVVDNRAGRGDEASCGHPSLLLEESSPLSARFGRQQSHLPSAGLEISCPSGESYHWKLDPVLVLAGRAASCKLRFLSAEISKIHFSLLRTRDGVWLVDLLGRGGIWVRGERVDYTRLVDGETIDLIHYQLRPFAVSGSENALVLTPDNEVCGSIDTALFPARADREQPTLPFPERYAPGSLPPSLHQLLDGLYRRQVSMFQGAMAQFQHQVEEMCAQTQSSLASLEEVAGIPPGERQRSRVVDEVQAILAALPALSDPHSLAKRLGDVPGTLRRLSS